MELWEELMVISVPCGNKIIDMVKNKAIGTISPKEIAKELLKEQFLPGYRMYKLGKLEEKENTRQAFKNGMQKGFTEAKRQLLERIKQDNNLRIGCFALSYYVACVDGFYAPEEQAEIESYMGQIDTRLLSSYMQRKLREILEDKPDFNTITVKYLDNIDDDDLKELDQLVKDVISADDKIMKEERDFYNNQWCIYLKDRGINVDNIGNI